MRSGRLLSVVLAVVLLGGGTAVFAATGGFKSAGARSSAASNQYCPDSSQQPGQPKKPGPAKCGAKISVKMRVSNRHPRRRHYVRFFGTVRPALDGRFVYVQRRGPNGRWYVVAKIKLRHFTSTRSKYSRRILVLRKGVYRARVPANSRSVSGTDPTAGLRRGTSKRKHLIVKG